MFFRKNLRKADKNISQDNDFIISSTGDAIIHVKANTHEQIFSSYNYDSNEKLNNELGEFIMDKAKFVPINKNITIKLFTEPSMDSKEIKKAIRNNYKKEYIEIKNETKRNLFFSLTMFVLGLLSLTFLLLMHTYFYNIYFDIIVEIATWVFVWEAVDSYFLQRASLKRKSIMILKLYSADIEIVKLETLKTNKIKIEKK